MKIHNAIIFASIKHQNQKRKGTNLPYIVHPMEVMQILTENGCSENVIVAGIMKDGKYSRPIPDEKFKSEDRLLVTGTNEDIEKMMKENN